MSRRDDIIKCALKIANKQGLAALAMRTIAETLSISPGNLTYHFATKEDLVTALYKQVQQTNNQVLAAAAQHPPTYEGLYNTLIDITHHQWKYRCIYLSSYNDLMRIKELRDANRKATTTRRLRFDTVINRLIESGVMKKDMGDQLKESLFVNSAILGKFWIQEYQTNYSHLSLTKALHFFSTSHMNSFLGIYTIKGLLQRDIFIKQKM